MMSKTHSMGPRKADWDSLALSSSPRFWWMIEVNAFRRNAIGHSECISTKCHSLFIVYYTVKEVKLAALFGLRWRDDWVRWLAEVRTIVRTLPLWWAIGMHWRRKRDNPTLCYIFTAAHGTFDQRYLLIYLRGHFWSYVYEQTLSYYKDTHFFCW